MNATTDAMVMRATNLIALPDSAGALNAAARSTARNTSVAPAGAGHLSDSRSRRTAQSPATATHAAIASRVVTVITPGTSNSARSNGSITARVVNNAREAPAAERTLA